MVILVRLLVALFAAFLIAVYFHMKESHRTSLYDEWIWEAAAKYEVDPFLIKAVIWRETEFDPYRIGAAQERGLMQVTPTAAEEWVKETKVNSFKLEKLFDPRTNIHAGSWYLSRALKRWKDWDDPIPFALAEYNAGRSNALRWATTEDNHKMTAKQFIENITFPTTRAYILTIMEKYIIYQSTTNNLSRWLPIQP